MWIEDQTGQATHFAYDMVGLPKWIKDLQGERSLVRAPQNNGGITVQVGATACVYDALGRLVRKGDLDLVYGADGHLSEARRPNTQLQFAYDEEGNRVLKLKNGVPVAGYLAGGYLTDKGMIEPVTVLGKLVGVIEQGTFHHLRTDSRGTVLADRDGTERLTTPFGVRATRPDVSAALDYVEKGYDADLGSVRMGVRDYDPQIGQFWTTELHIRLLYYTLQPAMLNLSWLSRFFDTISFYLVWSQEARNGNYTNDYWRGS